MVRTALAGDPSFKILLQQFATDGITNETIEDLLSRVRILRRIVGKGDARGLDELALSTLEKNICNQVVAAVRKDLPGTDTPYHRLADWIGGVTRATAIELFTTNYDLLMEQALEDRSLPFFDGFVGTREPFFDLRTIEDDSLPHRWTRLWKLHGCHSWCLKSNGNVVRSSMGHAPGDGLLIHPSELKYDQSRRMPYLAMVDRFRTFLRRPSAFLVTVGYGYGDEHLNEVVLQGLRSNPSAAAFGLLFKNLSSEPGALAIADRTPLNLTLLARDRGVMRSVASEWLPKTTKAGAHSVTNDLGDFNVFSRFLEGFIPTTGA
jgi:hypothetical protein